MKTRFFALVSVAFLAVTSAPGQVIEQSGDLRNDLFPQIQYPRLNGRYRIPTAGDLSVWRQAVDATLQGDLDTAAQVLASLAPSYKVVRYTDTSTPDARMYHLLLEAQVTLDGIVPTVVNGWGSYFFNPAPQRELSIHAPHPVYDAMTQGEGMDAFLQLQARSFLLAGTHRCASNTESLCNGTTTACSPSPLVVVPYRVSDPAHGARRDDTTVTNPFEIAHEAVFQLLPQTVAIQLHGFGDSLRRCQGVHALLSNTGDNYNVSADGNVLRLKASLGSLSEALNVQVCDHIPQSGECDRCGTNNLQGRWINGSTTNACLISAPATSDEQFIHIEQNPDMRTFYQGLLIQAIANTTFLQEEAGADSAAQCGLSVTAKK